MVDSLAKAVLEKGQEITDINLKIEGLPSEGWLVIDAGDVVVHIFSPDQRAYYRLEQLWEKGKVLVSLQ